jgi:NADP-dependent 3-hydroxy acid dehydrogenase YdfG
MQRILISGASKGVGRAIAMALAKSRSCALGLIARSADGLASVVDELQQYDCICESYVGNVGDPVFISATVARFKQAFGGIDLLVNNAGVGTFSTVDQTSFSDWEAMLSTNVTGTFLLCKECVPFMKEAGGHIVTIASDVSRRTFAGGGGYCATKYAQDALCLALRKEVRQFGIKVTVIYPGLIDTHFHSTPEGDASHSSWLKAEDIANTVQYIIDAPARIVIDEVVLHPLSQEY